MSTFTAMPSSLTSEDQERILAALSSDGTWEALDREKLARMIASNDASLVPVEDLVLVYTNLTNTFPSFWDAELVDPDLVDDLEEWADLAVSDDLAQDIRDFVALIGVDSELATALGGSSSSLLATSLGGQYTLSATAFSDIVTSTNEYWENKDSSSASADIDLQSVVETAFEMGAYGLAVIFILVGITDPDTGEKSGGFLDIVAEAQEILTEKILENSEALEDNAEEAASISSDDPNSSALLSAIKSDDERIGNSTSVLAQNATVLQTMVTTLIDMGAKAMDISYSTNQRINS